MIFCLLSSLLIIIIIIVTINHQQFLHTITRAHKHLLEDGVRVIGRSAEEDMEDCTDGIEGAGGDGRVVGDVQQFSHKSELQHEVLVPLLIAVK